MSIKIMNEAWEMKVGDPTKKLVLMCLADHANEDDRTCWPAIKRIGAKCEISRRTVQKYINALEDEGHIERRSRTGDSTLYFILPGLANKEDAKIIERVKNRGGANTAPVQGVAQGGATVCTGGVQLSAPKPSLNHKEPSFSICDFMDAALEIYNATAVHAGLPKALKLTPSRKTKLKARLKDCDNDLIKWSAAMLRLSKSDYCTGKVNGWRADLDFVLQEKSFTKLMEGSYDNRTTPVKTTAHQNTMDNIRSILADDEAKRRETENRTDTLGLLADQRGD